MAIKAKIVVDNKELKKGFKDAEKSASSSMQKIADTTKGVAGGFNGIIGSLGKFGPYAAVAAAAIFLVVKAITSTIRFVSSLASHLDNIAKSAKAVNLTTDAFQSLEYASKHTNIQMEQVMNMITKIEQTFVKAADGTKETIDAFAELGISWSELEKKSPDVWLLTLVQRLKQVHDLTKRNAILKDLGFNRRDIQNINKMVNGDYGRMVANAKNMGTNISERDIKLAERFKDVMGDVVDQFKNLVVQWKAFKNIEKNIMDIVKKAQQYAIKGDGRVKDEYTGLFYGIQDAADRVEAYTKKNDPTQYAQIKQVIQNIARKQAIKLIEEAGKPFKLAPKADQEKWIAEYLPKVNMEEIRREVWRYQATKYDPRFDVKDPNTWVQEELYDYGPTQLDKEKIIMDKINGSIKRLSDSLDEKTRKHKEHIAALQKELTLEELIKRIEDESGGKLNDEQRNQVKEIYSDYQKSQGADVAATLNDQTEKMRMEHQIQLALLNGDMKRAELLKMQLKLREAGIDASESEITNSDNIVDGLEEQIQKAKEAQAAQKSNFDKYEEIKAEYDSEKNVVEKFLEAAKAATEESLQTNDEELFARKIQQVQDLSERALKITQHMQTLEAQLNSAELKDAHEKYKALESEIKELEGRLGRAQGIQAGKNQVDEANKQAEEINDANLEKHTKELERENELIQAEIAGDWERANTLKLLNELKQMGIDIDEEELKKNEEKYRALQRELAERRRLNLARNVTDKENSLLIQAMKRVGLTKEAAYYEAILNAEKVKGAKLDYWEEQHIRNLVDIEMELNDPSNKLDLSGMDTKTNELTARGGFATGALTTPLETINSQIRDYAKRQTELLDKINNEIANGSVI